MSKGRPGYIDAVLGIERELLSVCTWVEEYTIHGGGTMEGKARYMARR